MLTPHIPRRGQPLPPAVRDWLEDRFGADLRAVRVHRGRQAAATLGRHRAAACAVGDDLLFAPGWYAPDTPAGRLLLAHEVAHTLQQRGGTGGPAGPAPGLEAEAWRAAAAVLAGRRAAVRPRPGCPAVQPALPALVVWGLIAAAAAITGAVAAAAGDDKANSTPDQHDYEVGWGFVPVYGSFDQMRHGRSAVQRFLGGAFLVLDLSLVGGVAVRGLVVAVKGSGLAGLRAVAAGGGTLAQRQGLDQLTRAEAKFFLQGSQREMTEQVAKAILEKAAGSPVLVATSEGTLNHSVTYAVRNGHMWRMHGGPMQMFFRTEAERLAARQGVLDGLARTVTQEELAGIVGRSNAVSVFQVTEAGAEQAVNFWAREAANGTLTQLLRAEGCASSQAMLLRQAGVRVPGAAVGWGGRAAPLLPVFLDAGRVGLGGGYQVMSRAGILGGSAIQWGLSAGMNVGVREMAWMQQDAFLHPDLWATDPLAAALAHGLASGLMAERVGVLKLADDLGRMATATLPPARPGLTTFTAPPELIAAGLAARYAYRGSPAGGPGAGGPPIPPSPAGRRLLDLLGPPGRRTGWPALRPRLPPVGLTDGRQYEAVQELEAKGYVRVERFGGDELNITAVTRLR